MSEMVTLKELFESGHLEKGSWISRPALEDRTYSITSEKSGYEEKQDFSIEKGQEILGRFVREKDGILEVAGRVMEPKVAFKGIAGVQNGLYELHNLCDKLYSSLEYGIVTRCINEEQYDALSGTKKAPRGQRRAEPVEQIEKEYWLAVMAISRTALGLGMKRIRGGIKETYYFFDISDQEKELKLNMYPYTNALCPWHFLAVGSPRLRVLVGEDCNGESSATPYRIVLG